MKSGNIFKIAGAIALMMVFSLSLANAQQKKGGPWDIPAKYKTMEKPANAEDVAVGKQLYMKNCASCHGRNGEGDGPKARNLDTFPGDMTSAEYKSLPEGHMFYMSKFGRDEMPSYEGKISDEEIWAIVEYMKTFE